MQMTVTERTLRLRTPLQTSYGAVRERRLLEVTLTDADGVQRPRRSGAAASPTTGSASPGCARRWRRTGRC